MTIVLFVEGYTEKSLAAFLKRWLDPQLTQPIRIRTVRFDGWADYVKDIRKKFLLNIATGGAIGSIGLLDLYGLGMAFPHTANTVATKYQWAKQEIESKVGDPRFRQHFAVHETEAWLLSEPAKLPAGVSQDVGRSCPRPEAVDFDTPPARLLDRLYEKHLRREYKKITDGANLFSAADPAAVAGKCPYFSTMLMDLLALARTR